jgi:hypothetical protein
LLPLLSLGQACFVPHKDIKTFIYKGFSDIERKKKITPLGMHLKRTESAFARFREYKF